MHGPVHSVQQTLERHGFNPGPLDGVLGPRTRAAVERFQQAFAGGVQGLPWLAIDGVPGPNTIRALAQLPHLSAHFTVAECASKDGAGCWVHRELLGALEQLRARCGNRPLVLLSVCRSNAHNKRVGGASDSMHLYGLAADLEDPPPLRDVLALRVFSGIGMTGTRVRHVDVRHLLGRKGTPATPARWNY